MRRKHLKITKKKKKTEKKAIGVTTAIPLPSRQKVSPADIDVIVSGIFENEKEKKKKNKKT